MVAFITITRMRLSTPVLLIFALHAFALSPDPSGASKVGNGAHQSSIGSQCLSSLDCGANGNTACCAFLPRAGEATIGICSGCGATTQAGKQGCGFGDEGKNVAGQPQVCPASSFAQGGTAAAAGGAAATGGSTNNTEAAGGGAAAASPPPPPPPPVASAQASTSPSTNCTKRRRSSAKHEQRQAAQRPPVLQPQPAQLPDPKLERLAGNGKNEQFVTGRCDSAADCGASQTDLSKVCCASVPDAATGQTVGVCSGSAVGSAAPKMGCGFSDGLASSAAVAKPAVAVAVAVAAAAGAGAGAGAAQGGAGTSGGQAACDMAGTLSSSSSSSADANPAAAASAQAAPVLQPQPAQLPDPGLDSGKGNQQNKQFVTGACVDSKDCGAQQADLGNVCCASVMSGGQVVGVCSGSAVGNAAPKMGCGFGDGKANSAL
ncbi:unnamed protein product [Discula destructiva]